MSGASVHRAGQVAIVGRPNVGKSTLLNHLVGHKLSITSRKPQTTRQRVTGILTREDAQIVFVDTPGVQAGHASALSRLMHRSVSSGLQDVDAVLWVVEALKFDGADKALLRLLPQRKPVVLAINKIDRVRDKKELLPFIGTLSGQFGFAAIVPVSAEKNLQIDVLLEALIPLLPEGPDQFGADELTTRNERFFAAELVREKLFRLLGDELPYATTVEIERFESRGGLRRIHAAVIVDKESHKAIVIGKDGGKLKAVATQARHDMERLFDGKVFLEVWVKVRRGWADDEAALRRMGFE